MFDREFHIRFTLADVGKALCFSPVLLVLVYLVICLPWGSKDAPSWVQAVGSIGAILAAIWISNDQSRRERQERFERDCRYMHKAFNTAFGGACSARALAGCLEACPNDFRSIELYLGQLKESVGDVERFSYAELLDIEFAETFMVHRRSLRFFVDEVGRYLSSGNAEVLTGGAHLASSIEKNVDSLWTSLEAFAQHAGVDLGKIRRTEEG